MKTIKTSSYRAKKRNNKTSGEVIRANLEKEGYTAFFGVDLRSSYDRKRLSNYSEFIEIRYYTSKWTERYCIMAR